MKKQAILFLLIFLTLLSFAFPVVAAPEMQPTAFPTPTPGPDGRIVYIVQPGDTLWRIAAIADLSIEQLRALNDLTPEDTISPGDEVFLGVGGPATAVPPAQPTVTPTPVGPTPTLEIGYGTICVILYQDINGDAIRQEEEPSLPRGAISIIGADGEVSITHETERGFDHICTDELGQQLKEGQYNVTVAIPEGYNPTMVLSEVVTLGKGEEVYLDFGAQPNSETLSEAPAPVGTGKSPLLGIFGALILLGGIGLGVYAAIFRRR